MSTKQRHGHWSAPAKRQRRYRVVVTEIANDDQATVVMDAIGTGFHAAVGELAGDRLTGEHGGAGPVGLLKRLAQLIADHPSGPPGARR